MDDIAGDVSNLIQMQGEMQCNNAIRFDNSVSEVKRGVSECVNVDSLLTASFSLISHMSLYDPR